MLFRSRLDIDVYEKNRNKAQKYLRNETNLSNVFYKIFLASPFTALNENTKNNNNLSISQAPPVGSLQVSSVPEDTKSTEPWGETPNVYNQSNEQRKSIKTDWEISPVKNLSKNDIMPKIPEEIRRSTSLNETIKPLSTSNFIDLSGGEKYIKTYPKNWKRVITEKYYQNPIYKTVLSNDLKNFLKREPLTQQLTNNQENELYFLRVKMAHYYDSLRFYFNLKEQINNTRSKAESVLNSLSEGGTHIKAGRRIKPQTSKVEKIRLKRKPKQVLRSAGNEEKPIITGGEEWLTSPPFQFKSMTSMNYRQQFKGTLKTVKQLFAVSLPESVSAIDNRKYEKVSNWDNDYNFSYNDSPIGESHADSSAWTNNRGATSPRSNQRYNGFFSSKRKTEPIEKSYKYDKYLFNEYAYPKNEFLHEEGRGFSNRKSTTQRPPPSNFRESPSQNSTLLPTETKGGGFSTEARTSRGYRGIGLATKNIYNMFGSNDPFYVEIGRAHV